MLMASKDSLSGHSICRLQTNCKMLAASASEVHPPASQSLHSKSAQVVARRLTQELTVSPEERVLVPYSSSGCVHCAVTTCQIGRTHASVSSSLERDKENAFKSMHKALTFLIGTIWIRTAVDRRQMYTYMQSMPESKL